ncbi:hypothetical protein GCM10020221_02440 [Streptomyces thioluteus]|uniref:Uncharacterized protein n=1 Tax=Streptomyces thioluteus TaxID=66431 RepID=A0ABP6IUI6_STRTU
MPVEEGLTGGAQGPGVHGALEVEDQLYGVDIRSLAVEKGVVDQPFLQRRQRPDVLELMRHG